jgi:hypothetical protein
VGSLPGRRAQSKQANEDARRGNLPLPLPLPLPLNLPRLTRATIFVPGRRGADKDGGASSIEED